MPFQNQSTEGFQESHITEEGLKDILRSEVNALDQNQNDVIKKTGAELENLKINIQRLKKLDNDDVEKKGENDYLVSRLETAINRSEDDKDSKISSDEIESPNEEDVGEENTITSAEPEPEKPKTFIDKLGSGLESLSKKFESMQNFIAYHFAPILESLQKIKIPFLGDMQANIDGFMGFVGMNRTMLFGSIRKNKIDPVLRPDTPHLDTQAIQSLVGMAENIRATCPGYTVKEFFDAATTGFALHLKNAHNDRKVFVLDELATFVANSDIPKKQKEYADKLPKPVATPLTTAATVGMPGSPSAPSATPAPTTTPAVTSEPVTTPTPAVPPPPPPAVPAP